MVRSHVFGFVTIAMCLAACLCVSANGAETEQEKAEKAVDAVADLAQNELHSATANFRQANSMLTRVQSHKTRAETAISQVKDVPNGNANAEAIAKEVKTTANEVIALYPKAHKAASDAVSKMRDMVTKANALVAQANIDTDLDSDSSSDYTQINDQVSQVTAKVGTFRTEMQQEVKILDPAGNLEFQMSGLVEKVLVGKYHFFVTLSISQIDTVLKKADVDIGKTEEKRDEVNKTLREMMEASQKAPQKLSVYVNKMLLDAEGALVTATKAVADAKKVKGDMMEIKTKAEASLAKFAGEKNPLKVEGEVRTVKQYAEDVAKKAPGIASALQSAEITATTAESRKQSFISVISSDDIQPSGEDDKITNKPGEPVKDSTTKPTSKEGSQPSEKISEKPVKDSTTKPTSKEGSQPSEKISENPVKSGEKSPVNNERALPSGANSDSAITVSFSLLLVLLACASLH